MCLKEWQNLVIEHVGCCDGCFGGVELRKGDLAVSIDKRLLIDTPYTFEIAYIKGVGRPQVTGVSRFYLTTSLIVMLFFSRAATWASLRIMPSLATFSSSALSRFLKVFKVMPYPDRAHATTGYKHTDLAQFIAGSMLSKCRLFNG